MSGPWRRASEHATGLIDGVVHRYPGMRPSAVRVVACSHDANFVLTADDAHGLRRFVIENRRQSRVRRRVTHIALNDTGSRSFASDAKGALHSFVGVLPDGADASLPATPDDATVVALAYDGSQLVVAYGTDGGLVIGAGDTARRLAGSTAAHAMSARLSTDARWLIAADAGCEVTVWDTETGDVAGQKTMDSPPHALAVAGSSDAPLRVAVATARGTRVADWEEDEHEPVWRDWPTSGDESGLALSADGSKLVTTNSSGLVRVWESDDDLPIVALPRRLSLMVVALVAFACWWVRRSLDDILRDLHLPGSSGAYGVGDMLSPTTVPGTMIDRLQVWRDWDVSRSVLGQNITSHSVLLVYTLVDVVLALLVGAVLSSAARSRWRARFVDRSERASALQPILAAAAIGAWVYVVFDVGESVAFFVAGQSAGDVSAPATVAYVVGCAKWVMFALVVLPILVSFVLEEPERSQHRLSRRTRPRAVPSIIDLRAQTLAVVIVVAAFLLLPSSVRPQMLDLVRGWTFSQWCASTAAVLVCCTIVLVTGIRVLERVDARREGVATDPQPHGPDQDRGVTTLHRGVVGAVGVACFVVAALLWAFLGEGALFAVVGGLIVLWSSALMLTPVRRLVPRRPGYLPFFGAVRALAFLPAYALGLVIVEARLPLAWTPSNRPASIGAGLFGIALAVGVGGVVYRPSTSSLKGFTEWWLGARPAKFEPADAALSLGAREIAVPLVAATLAAVALVLADDSSFGTPFGYGAVALITLFAIAVLGVLTTITTVAFRPPRGILAVLGFKRFPIIALTVLVLIAVSALVTRPGFHRADLVSYAKGVSPRADPATVQEAFDRWVGLQQSAEPVGSGRTWTPLVIVSASGGGGRAAYWTYLALDCLFESPPAGETAALAGQPACTSDAAAQAAEPDLGDVFAISGISGGSTGAAMFVAAAADGASPPQADTVFEHGFVDPVVSNLLVRDVPNAWLQDPDMEDRAERLEKAWELAVPQMAANFFQPMSTEVWTPQLILNSAAVQDGCRVVVANLAVAVDTRTLPPTPTELSGSCRSFVSQRLAPPAPPEVLLPPSADAATTDIDTASNPWPASRDLATVLCPTQNLAISTAALLSARFPYVSPSGAVPVCHSDSYLYLVDGGTVDSSAAAPAALLLEEVVRLARAWNDLHPTLPCVQPVVLQIDNGYEDVVATSSVDRPSELLAPIQGGLSAITSNAETARQQLAFAAADLSRRSGCQDVRGLPTFLQIFPQSHPGVEAPLGWSLSGGAREDMRQQMSTAANQCSLMALRYWLTADAGTGSCVAGTVQSAMTGRALAGRSVCLEGEPNPTSTNAYGVFVHVYRDAPLPAPDALVCPSSKLTRIGDGHGPAQQINVTVPFAANDETLEVEGSADPAWALAAALVVLVVMIGWVMVCKRSNRLSESERSTAPA